MPQETAGLFDRPKSTDLRTNDPDELQKRILALLKACCEREQACFACGAPMYFVRMRKSGKLNPYSAHGVSHFADCPDADRFRAAWNDAKAGAR